MHVRQARHRRPADLYNNRHAVELALKFTIRKLADSGVLTERPPADHDILKLFNLLRDANLGDEELRTILNAMEPYVVSLARVDGNGQELRYHLNRDEKPNLATLFAR